MRPTQNDIHVELNARQVHRRGYTDSLTVLQTQTQINRYLAFVEIINVEHNNIISTVVQ